MSRWFALLALACLAGAAALALRPDPWARAGEKAAQDAALLAGLSAQPDRIGWRLTEDPALQRALLWDAGGTRLYPPPDGLAPRPYEFSDDQIRGLAALQARAAPEVWERFEGAGDRLLHCRASPALCLIYDRPALEAELGLRAGALLSGPASPLPALALALLAALCAVAALWPRLRRPGPPQGFRLLPERHAALRGTLEVQLTPRDLKLLTLLEERDGAVVTKDELYDAGWGRDYMPNSRALDQHIITLRRKLDPDKTRPPLIETVHGVGYRLARPR